MKILFCFTLFLTTAFGQKDLLAQKTNLQIADSLTLSVLADYLQDIRKNDLDSILIDVSHLETVKQDYLRILLGNWFHANSFQVFRNYHQGLSFQGMVFEINAYQLDVFYSKPYEKKFFGSDFINRRILLNLNGQFYITGSQKVQIAVVREINYSDEIPYAEISAMELSGYPFARGRREDYSFWDKMYEPVLAVTSVAILVFLFFSQRT